MLTGLSLRLCVCFVDLSSLPLTRVHTHLKLLHVIQKNYRKRRLRLDLQKVYTYILDPVREIGKLVIKHEDKSQESTV